jgi:16S rRNA (adenine(1408)-N(1))-methyltransferase
VVDLGTGDGRFVLHVASSEPRALVIGIDADASSMIEASRRADRSSVPNALFVVASVECLPRELGGVADEVRIHFPWGSLLRGLVDVDGAVVAQIAGLCAPGASVTALVSITERDRRLGAVLPADPRTLEPGFAAFGLALTEARKATLEEIRASHSTWAKRLGAGSRRPVTLLRLIRISAVQSSSGSC